MNTDAILDRLNQMRRAMILAQHIARVLRTDFTGVR